MNGAATADGRVAAIHDAGSGELVVEIWDPDTLSLDGRVRLARGPAATVQVERGGLAVSDRDLRPGELGLDARLAYALGRSPTGRWRLLPVEGGVRFEDRRGVAAPVTLPDPAGALATAASPDDRFPAFLRFRGGLVVFDLSAGIPVYADPAATGPLAMGARHVAYAARVDGAPTLRLGRLGRPVPAWAHPLPNPPAGLALSVDAHLLAAAWPSEGGLRIAAWDPRRGGELAAITLRACPLDGPVPLALANGRVFVGVPGGIVVLGEGTARLAAVGGAIPRSLAPLPAGDGPPRVALLDRDGRVLLVEP